MWKNKKLYKKLTLKKLNRVYVKYKIKGLNLFRLIDLVKKRGITIYKLKKTSEKSISLLVKVGDSEKFFAIAKELCYNIKKVGYRGVLYPVYYLVNNIGIVIGSLIFIIIPILCSDVIFAFSFTGSGAIYKREIKEFLLSKNITEFSRFSSLDLVSLSDEILAFSDKLTFVEVGKKGNRLVIDSALSSGTPLAPKNPSPQLISDVVGEVLELKVYRGSAVVEENQLVNVGDLIVDGIVFIKDKEIKVNVKAKVLINAHFTYTYITDKDNMEEKAVIFAEQQIPEKQITYRKVEKNLVGNKFEYKVTLKYKHIIEVE